MSKGASVLVVEDEKPLRDVYEIILSTAGYKVSTAINGREALDHVRRFTPDFILLDIFMPLMSGLEFLRALDPAERAAIPIVVFSNNSDSGVREEVCQLGARDIVLKSDVAPTDLTKLVERYIS